MSLAKSMHEDVKDGANGSTGTAMKTCGSAQGRFSKSTQPGSRSAPGSEAFELLRSPVDAHDSYMLMIGLADYSSFRLARKLAFARDVAASFAHQFPALLFYIRSFSARVSLYQLGAPRSQLVNNRYC